VAANARRGIRAGSAVWGEGSAGPARSANPANPSPRSRYIPAAVRRAVWARDGGQCAFVAANGRRCPERGFLEFHHVEPYAAGGAATVDNIQLRCRSHNG
jgi:5-methylcytosine-specific restriction endonuclease McrA